MNTRHMLTIPLAEAAKLSGEGKLIGRVFETRCGINWAIPDITRENFEDWSLCEKCEQIVKEEGLDYVPDRKLDENLPFAKELRKELDLVSDVLVKLSIYAAEMPEGDESLRDRLKSLHDAAHAFSESMCELLALDQRRMDGLN